LQLDFKYFGQFFCSPVATGEAPVFNKTGPNKFPLIVLKYMQVLSNLFLYKCKFEELVFDKTYYFSKAFL
jgi:hypothetical protein